MQQVNKSWCSLWHSVIGLQSWSPQELRKIRQDFYSFFLCIIGGRIATMATSAIKSVSACGNTLKSTYILTAINLRHFFLWNMQYGISIHFKWYYQNCYCTKFWHGIPFSFFFFLLQADTHFFPLCLPHTNRLGIACKCVSKKPQTTTLCLCLLSCQGFHVSCPCTEKETLTPSAGQAKPSVRDSGSTTKLNAVPKPDLSTKSSKKQVSSLTLVPHSKVMTPELCSAKMLWLKITRKHCSEGSRENGKSFVFNSVNTNCQECFMIL